MEFRDDITIMHYHMEKKKDNDMEAMAEVP